MTKPPTTPVMEVLRGRLPLTIRELETLRGMANGESNKDIGRRLNVSEDTVKTHARRLFHKFNAKDRPHAVSLGYRYGYLKIGDQPPLEQATHVMPYFKRNARDLTELAELDKPAEPAEPAAPALVNATPSTGCCLHCRAMYPVLADGYGDHGMGRRMVNAIRAAKQREMLHEYKSAKDSEKNAD